MNTSVTRVFAKIILFVSLISGPAAFCQTNTFPTDGNVGIGTLTPDNYGSWDKVLNLHGTNHAKLLVTENSGVKTGIFSHVGAQGMIGTESNHNLALWAGYANRVMTLTTDGHVMIGKDAPDNAQSWRKTLTLHGSDHAKLLVTEGTGIKTGIFSHVGANGRIGTESSHNLSLTAGYLNDVMTLTTGGNVGIGTLTPAEKLSVNGRVRAHEVKVEIANWPDYVFAPSYKLPALKETARFIKQNGHLPGIPTESEVAKHGVDLGDMNAKLLKKIEELTLYLIDLNDKLEKQTRRNAEQQAQIDMLTSK